MSTYKVPSHRRLDKIIAEFKNGLIKWLAAAGIILILVWLVEYPKTHPTVSIKESIKKQEYVEVKSNNLYLTHDTHRFKKDWSVSIIGRKLLNGKKIYWLKLTAIYAIGNDREFWTERSYGKHLEVYTTDTLETNREYERARILIPTHLYWHTDDDQTLILKCSQNGLNIFSYYAAFYGYYPLNHRRMEILLKEPFVKITFPLEIEGLEGIKETPVDKDKRKCLYEMFALVDETLDHY